MTQLPRGLPPVEIYLEQTSSTNDVAFSTLSSETPLCLVWTRDQRQGRGTRGRSWLTPPGHGLAMSLGIAHPAVPSPNAFSYPLFAGLLLHRVLVGLGVPISALRLKWPNDLLLNQRKLAGILCESRWRGQAARLVIGTGLNLRPAPQLAGLDRPVSYLAQIDDPPTARDIVNEYAKQFWPLLSQYRQTTEAMHSDWFTHAWARPGQSITWEEHGLRRRGKLLGLDSQGQLQIATGPGQTQTLNQADQNLRLRTETGF